MAFFPVIARPVSPSAPATADGAAAEVVEQELIEALLQGDTRAAAVLYDYLRPAIEHALRRVLHGRHRDFDDLKQTTFERILRALAEGRFEGRSSMKTWAAAIAAHVALDALRVLFREERRHAPLAEEMVQGITPRPEARLEALAELRRVQGLLSRMKPNLVEALLLHDVLGHPLEEIAALAGASPSATQSRLHRARLELKRRAGTSREGASR